MVPKQKRPKELLARTEHYLTQLLISDAPLKYTPSAIALSAMREAANDLSEEQRTTVLAFISALLSGKGLEQTVTVTSEDLDAIEREGSAYRERCQVMSDDDWEELRSKWRKAAAALANPLRSAQSPLRQYVEEEEKSERQKEKAASRAVDAKDELDDMLTERRTQSSDEKSGSALKRRKQS